LPWKTWPSFEKLRVVVQFASADGRLFEADRDVTIRLAPPTARKTAECENRGPEFMQPPPHGAPPPPPSGPGVQPAAAWQKASDAPLFDAVKLLPPEEIAPKSLAGVGGF
jgi:hypothetical protein